MKVLTFLNEKGGVGKTTLAVHAAAGLAIRGKRVLLIDADAQAHSTFLLRQKEYGGLYRLLVHEEEWKAVLRQPEPHIWSPPDMKVGKLYLLPSNIETRAIPTVVSDATLLRERLEELETYVDIVVIDTSPTPSLLHAMIYVASDYVVIPTACEAMALDGLAKTAARVKKGNPIMRAKGSADLCLLGVQPVMFDARTNAHDFGIEQIIKHFGEDITWDAVAMRTAWRDASFARKTVFAYAPSSLAAKEAWEVVNRVELGVRHG